MHEPETEKPDEKLGDKKLKLAGYSYILGDLAGVASSVARGDFKRNWSTAAGFSTWLAGGIAAARYGNPDTEKQLEILAHKLKSHLAARGVTVTRDDASPNALLHHTGLWQGIERFLYEHPSEMLNAAYALGAGMMIHNGVKSIRKGDHSYFGSKSAPIMTDFWSGLLVLAGALGGLLIKEDPNAAEKAKNGSTLDKTKAYFTEKANRFPGLMYGLNNVVLAGRVLQEQKKFKNSAVSFKPHYFSAVTLATYVFSNILLQFSAREQITAKLPSAEVAKLEDAAARIISAQPEAMQQAVLADVSEYLAAQKGVGQSTPEIAQTLANRLTELTQARAQEAVDSVSWAAREKAKLAKMGMDVGEPARG